MRAALEVETLKLRRATTARVSGAVVAVLMPVAAAGLLAAARAGGNSTMAAKVRPMLVGTGWEAYLGVLAQMMAVGTLLAVGVVVCWSFGREHTDGTFGALFALPVSRRTIAGAKLVVVLGWGAGAVAAAALVALVAGMLTGLGAPGADAVGGAVRVLATGWLTVLLTVPLALVSSAARGYLPGIGALLGVVVVTQVATLLGAGAWFPYAAPGLWAGAGGAQAAHEVTALQLLLAVPVALAGAAATIRWWGRAQAL